MARGSRDGALKRALRWLLWVLEAIPFFAAMGIFRILGLDAASAFGGWITRTLAPISPAHALARRNLQHAMPEKTPAEVKAILRGMWDNLGRTFAEYPHFRRFDGFPNPRIALTGAENLRAALARGAGAIAVSGHFGNWELMLVNARNAGFDGAALYRPVNNPIVNAWIVRQRRTYAYPLQVSKTGDSARDLLRTLKANKTVALLADQKHREGDPVPFFGRTAMTVTGPAVLALRTGAPLVPVSIVRVRGSHFHLNVLPELDVPRTGDKTADQAAILLAINRWLEDVIRAAPSMWLWAHDRWMERG